MGAIPYCDNLHLHLVNYKINDPDNDYVRLSDPNEPSWMDKGDVGIFGSSSDYWQHAVFAVTGENGSNILYNANTENRQHKAVSWFYGGWPSCDFYHIKDYLSPPDFCFNCIWDEEEGEVGPDCGGPCPPCESAPEYANFNDPTNNLPDVTLAMIEIDVDILGSGNISVEPYQNVTFKAGESIKLHPGFHAKSNSNFKASTTNNINELTRLCDKTCYPTHYYGFVRPCGYELDLVNIEYYDIEVYQWCGGELQLIYANTGYIDENVRFCFWDGCEGVDFNCFYQNEFGILLDIVSCYDNTIITYNDWIGVVGECNKAINDDEYVQTENIYYDILDNSANDCLIYPNPHPGIFTIEWNDETISEFTIQVFNMMGKPVYTRQHAQPGITQVDISGQAKGIYLVTLQSGDKVITERVVYQ